VSYLIVSKNSQDLKLFNQNGVTLHQNNTMGRQSISFTEQNDDWIKSQVSNNEYSTKSELMNDLVRQARGQQVKVNWIAAKLEKAEKSGFTDMNKAEILAELKAEINV
jgi:antitoxin ParD1/3/4